jgi:D-alanyl-D-alanine carboxypeptidase
VVIGKTGYTIEAGRTLVVRVTLQGHAVDMVFLGSREWASVFGDAGRVRRWLEPQLVREAAASTSANQRSPGEERIGEVLKK